MSKISLVIKVTKDIPENPYLIIGLHRNKDKISEWRRQDLELVAIITNHFG